MTRKRRHQRRRNPAALGMLLTAVAVSGLAFSPRMVTYAQFNAQAPPGQMTVTALSSSVLDPDVTKIQLKDLKPGEFPCGYAFITNRSGRTLTLSVEPHLQKQLSATIDPAEVAAGDVATVKLTGHVQGPEEYVGYILVTALNGFLATRIDVGIDVDAPPEKPPIEKPPCDPTKGNCVTGGGDLGPHPPKLPSTLVPKVPGLPVRPPELQLNRSVQLNRDGSVTTDPVPGDNQTLDGRETE